MRPRRHIIPVFVPHLGCPNDCVFCNQRRISGHLAPATEDTVRTEIENALMRIPFGAETELAFYGGSFTAIEESVQTSLLAAVQPYIRDKRISSIRLSTRPDCVDAGTVERLLQYNVKTVELGVQSMCDDVLEASGRGHTAEDAVRAAGIVKNAGLELILQMMTGLPGDTPEKSMYTARRIAELRPDGVRIYPTVIIRDTRLYDMWKAGQYREHTVDEASEICCGLLDIFEDEGIPVIRLGLNPTAELTESSAAGGAYHPAFGQIVEGKRYLKAAIALTDELLAEGPLPEELGFVVPKGDTSAFVGQRRCNITALREKYGIKRITVSETAEKSVGRLSLSLKTDAGK